MSSPPQQACEPAETVAARSPAPRRVLICHAGAELYGADYVLLQLCAHLKRRGHAPVVVLPFHGPLCEELTRVGVASHIRAMPVLRRKYFTPWGIFIYGGLIVSSLWQVAAIARRERIDLYHTNTAGVWTGGLLARLQGRRHIWQVMELVEKPRIVALIMSKAVGLLATRVFCISDAVRSHFVHFNSGRAHRFATLYHGVDTAIFAPSRANGPAIRAALGIPPSAIVILYASRFSAWKGQDVFARAAGLLSADTTKAADVHFVMLGSCFAGQEHHEEELRTTLATFPSLAGKIHLPGFQKNLPDWLAAADVFVLPSKNPEPNATVLIAAMVMGLPCIGTNIGGTVETIVDGETGRLIAPNDPEALSLAMRELVADGQRRRDWGAAGRRRAHQLFSLQNYCQTVEASYG